MDRRRARRLPAHAGFGLHRRSDRQSRWRISGELTWYPTEFSKIRLQYNHDFLERTISFRPGRSRFGLPPVRIHPRRARRAQILNALSPCHPERSAAESKNLASVRSRLCQRRRSACEALSVCAARDDKRVRRNFSIMKTNNLRKQHRCLSLPANASDRAGQTQRRRHAARFRRARARNRRRQSRRHRAGEADRRSALRRCAAQLCRQVAQAPTC